MYDIIVTTYMYMYVWYTCTYIYLHVHVHVRITIFTSNLFVFDAQLIESDIQAHQDQVDDIMARVRAFRESGHFQIDQIEDRGRELVAK